MTSSDSYISESNKEEEDANLSISINNAKFETTQQQLEDIKDRVEHIGYLDNSVNQNYYTQPQQKGVDVDQK